MRAQIVRCAHALPMVTGVLSTLALGCTDSNSPTSPQAVEPSTVLSSAELQAVSGRGADGEFTRLARQVPGFGGMYYDKAGRLNVYLTKPPAGSAARGGDVASRLRSLGGPATQRRMKSSAGVITQTAKYDYLQLQGYRARLRNIFRVRGVVYTDTDEARNRVRVAITPGAAE